MSPASSSTTLGNWSALLATLRVRPPPARGLARGRVDPYLTGTQAQHLLGLPSELALAGSRLLVDVFSHSFLTSPQLAGFRAMMAANNSPLRFGTDHPNTLVADHGWRPMVTRFGDDGANYGRWGMPEGYRQDPDSPQGYLIVADR